MSYQRFYLVAATLVTLVCARDATTATTPPLHQPHGHHNLGHLSLVKFGDEDFGNAVLSRSRRGLKDKINLLGVLGQLYTEQREDQDLAFQKISALLADSVAPEPTNETTTSTTARAPSAGEDGGQDSSSEAPGSSTTARPYRATASQLMVVLRRNIVGLRNLFNKEWAIAMEDSKKNTAAAKAEFRESARPFFRKNGTASG